MERIAEYQEKMERYGWNMEVPFSRESDTAKVYVIRHGLSMFNAKAAEVEAEFTKNSPEFQAVQLDTGLIDPDLHPVGVVQAEVNSPKIDAMNVKYVLVSPMQRAMQTCIHMFKSHPNLNNIRFFVEPHVHEIMHTMNDICMDADELVQKYAPGQEICCGVNFDFSRLSAN